MSADKETAPYFIEPGNYSTQILTSESFGTSFSALSHVHTINCHLILKQEQKQEQEKEQQQQQQQRRRQQQRQQQQQQQEHEKEQK